MTTAGFAGARCPINDNKAETHYHKQEAYSSEAGSLKKRELKTVSENRRIEDYCRNVNGYIMFRLSLYPLKEDTTDFTLKFSLLFTRSTGSVCKSICIISSVVLEGAF